MKKKSTVETLAKSVVRELRQLKGNVWGHYVHNVQRGESIMHSAIEDMIFDLSVDKANKLTLEDLSAIYDSGDESAYSEEVESVFEKYIEEGMPIKKFLSELRLELRDAVRSMIESGVWKIAADADREKLDDGC